MKVLKLFIDENIKIWKKFSNKLLILAVVLSLFGVLGLTKFMQHIEEDNQISVQVESSNEYLKNEINYLKEQLKNEDMDAESKDSIQKQLGEYELYLEYDISLYEDTWKNDIVRRIVDLRQNEQKDEAEKLIQI